MTAAKLLVALVTIVFAALVSAAHQPAAEPSIDELAKHKHRCRAVRNHGQIGEMSLFDLDAVEVKPGLIVEKRDEASIQTLAARDEHHCYITGHIVNEPKVTYCQHHVTLRQCANWCLCTLGAKYCRSFQFEPNHPGAQRGTCSTYKVEARHLDIKPGGHQIFYAHHCFHKSKPVTPSPPMSSGPPTYPTPPPYPKYPTKLIRKRDDAFGDVLADALAKL